jgi:hypothetical protein
VLWSVGAAAKSIYNAVTALSDISLLQELYAQRLLSLHCAIIEEHRGLTPHEIIMGSVADVEYDITRVFFGAVPSSTKTHQALPANPFEANYYSNIAPHLVVAGGETPSTRAALIRLLYYIRCAHVVRRELARLTLIPVMGIQKSGKSTLIETLTKASCGSGAPRTRLPTIVPAVLESKEGALVPLTLADFPASNDGQRVYMGIGEQLIAVSAAAVLVLDFKWGDADTVQELLRRVTGVGGPARILVLFNMVDVVFDNAYTDYMNRELKATAAKAAVVKEGVFHTSRKHDDDGDDDGDGDTLAQHGLAGVSVPGGVGFGLASAVEQAASVYAAGFVVQKYERAIKELSVVVNSKRKVTYWLSSLRYMSKKEISRSISGDTGISMSQTQREAAIRTLSTLSHINSALQSGGASTSSSTTSGTTAGSKASLPSRIAFCGDVYDWLTDAALEWEKEGKTLITARPDIV